jgi:hypothetical protein
MLIIGGKAYNLETSDLLSETDCRYEKRGTQWHRHVALYRTQKGALFAVQTERRGGSSRERKTFWAV